MAGMLLVLLGISSVISEAIPDASCTAPGTVARLLLQTRAQEKAVPSEGFCPSDTFNLPVPTAGTNSSYTRVILADFPSTGSTWMRNMLDTVCTSGFGLECGPPGCSVYDDCNPTNESEKHEDFWCPAGWHQEDGSVLIKTHFPSAEFGEYQDSEVYAASTSFDKVVMMVRHPISLIDSMMYRFSSTAGSNERLKNETIVAAWNLACWGEWWRRVANNLGAGKVHIMRYEDLCFDAVNQLDQIAQFMGGRYRNITKVHLQRMIDNNLDYACIHRDALVNVVEKKTEMDNRIMCIVGNLFEYWGYNESSPYSKEHVEGEWPLY